MTWCVRVPKEQGERVKREFVQMGILDRSYRILREGDFLYLPISGDPPEGHEVVDKEMDGITAAETDFHKIARVPEELKPLLPSSFDIIGDMAIVKIPDELDSYEEEIGRAMAAANPRLRLVLADKGVKGECRIRELRRIFGEGDSRSIHTEFGVRMVIDPRLVYFNPRLANERYRVAMSVKEGETIVDMFSGAGPFPLVIRKHSSPWMIYAIDINEDAIRLMEENIRLNKADRIVPILGDARKAMGGLPEADRIIMNLPQTSIDFFPTALEKTAPGGIIHLYAISEREEWDDKIKGLIRLSEEMGRPVEVDAEHELKTYSPTMSVYALDLRRV